MTAQPFSPIWRVSVIAVVAAAALGGGLLVGQAMSPDPAAILAGVQQATVLRGPGRPLPEFSLLDHAGRTFGPSRLRGGWSAMFFGYTHCPDVCPVTLDTMKSALASLRARDADAPPITVYFVSVDPERDPPEHLGKYVTYFDPAFVGVTGPHPELARLTKALGIAHVKPQGQEGEQYLVDHSASILLLDPEGELRAVFSPPHDARVLSADLALILEAGALGRS